MNKIYLGQKRKSGEVCPLAGYWKSDQSHSEIIEMKKGSLFPKHSSGPINWFFVSPEIPG